MKKKPKFGVNPIFLPLDGTFAELMREIDRKDRLRRSRYFLEIFQEKLEEHFSAEPILVARVEGIMDNPEELGSAVVLELFEHYGFHEEDIESFLPIKFE